mgnify:CR=1 FL=1
MAQSALLVCAATSALPNRICDFADANLGAHHELQISLFATPRSSPPLPADPFAFFRALATRPDLLMVCHGLWNNTRRVVRYNTEHLRLNARLTQSEVKFEHSRWAFDSRDVQGALIAAGAVRASHVQPAARHGRSLARWVCERCCA